MTSAQLTGWLAYMRAEPFGAQQRDRGVALLAALVASIFHDKGPRPTIAGMFNMIQDEPIEEPVYRMTPEQIWAAIGGAAATGKTGLTDDD